MSLKATAATPSTTPRCACDLSLDEHIEISLSAFALLGVGVTCERQYQALLVLAEVARRLHNHDTFDPSEDADRYETAARAALNGFRKPGRKPS